MIKEVSRRKKENGSKIPAEMAEGGMNHGEGHKVRYLSVR